MRCKHTVARCIACLLLLFLLITTSCIAQSRQDSLFGSWIISGQAQHFNFNSSASYSFGMGAEWFFGNRWSIRGGLSASDSYLRIATSPIALLLLSKVKSKGTTDAKLILTAAVALSALLINTDGIAYHFPISRNFYITPYIAPLQALFYFKPTESVSPLKLKSAGGSRIGIY